MVPRRVLGFLIQRCKLSILSRVEADPQAVIGLSFRCHR